MTSTWYETQSKQLVNYIETETKKMKNSEKNKLNILESKLGGFETRVKKEQKRVDNIIGRYKSDMKKFGGPSQVPSVVKMPEMIKKHETFYHLKQADERISKNPDAYNPIKSSNRELLKKGELSYARAEFLLKQTKRERSTKGSKKKLAKK